MFALILDKRFTVVARKYVRLSKYPLLKFSLMKQSLAKIGEPVVPQKVIIFVLNALHCLVLFSKWRIRIQLSQRYI